MSTSWNSFIEKQHRNNKRNAEDVKRSSDAQKRGNEENKRINDANKRSAEPLSEMDAL